MARESEKSGSRTSSVRGLIAALVLASLPAASFCDAPFGAPVEGSSSPADEKKRALPLHGLDPPVLLPDGQEFKTWEVPLAFTRTYHVDPSSPRASDNGPGTEYEPFATIGRAAEVLQPGERVIVGAGVYRERVRPARGGTGPGSMISYEAAPGAQVVLKGSVVLRADWSPSTPDGKTALKDAWKTKLEPHLFDGDAYDAFNVDNVTEEQFRTMEWAQPLRGKPPCNLVRGLVFQDGRLLRQGAAYENLAGAEGTYWVDRTHHMLHVRPFSSKSPKEATWEIATRETVLAPDRTGLGFIRVKGFTLEQVAGPFPWPQVGALSTSRGHHWIIEDNTVRWVNGVGIDVGIQHPSLPQPERVGRHIVRRNTVTDCGICGIAGLGPGRGIDFGILVEDNVVLRNAFFDVETLFETAGIKTHNNIRCLIRRNLVVDTLHGPGIWIDWDNRFSRLTQNVIIGTRTMHGGIFVEASYEPNLIDRDFVWGTTGNGVYEHDSCNQVFAHNFVGRSSRSGFHLHGKITDRRISGREIVGGRHRVRNNVLFENAEADIFLGEASDVRDNLLGGVSVAFEPMTTELVWSVGGEIPRCVSIPGITRDFFEKPLPAQEPPPGPFGHVPRKSSELRLWPIASGAPALPAR